MNISRDLRSNVPSRRGLRRGLRRMVGGLLVLSYVLPLFVLLTGSAAPKSEAESLLADLRANICSQWTPGPGDDQGQRDRDNAKGCCILCHMPGTPAPTGIVERLAVQFAWTRQRPIPPVDRTRHDDQTERRTKPPRAPPAFSA